MRLNDIDFDFDYDVDFCEDEITINAYLDETKELDDICGIKCPENESLYDLGVQVNYYAIFTHNDNYEDFYVEVCVTVDDFDWLVLEENELAMSLEPLMNNNVSYHEVSLTPDEKNAVMTEFINYISACEGGKNFGKIVDELVKENNEYCK